MRDIGREHLAPADRHVADTEARVAAQTARVAAVAPDAGELASAEGLLAVVRRRDRLRRGRSRHPDSGRAAGQGRRGDPRPPPGGRGRGAPAGGAHGGGPGLGDVPPGDVVWTGFRVTGEGTACHVELDPLEEGG